MDAIWAKYYASGDRELIKKLITEGLPLIVLAHQLRDEGQGDASVQLMQIYQYVCTSLVSEGTWAIF